VTTAHPIQRLYLAEDLVRRRRADEHRRYAASQRAARIDPNPHQIDEVGLGKTIEAGLVIAQLRAEGARRILVVTPKALQSLARQASHRCAQLPGRCPSAPSRAASWG
jgi:hypothetical protein